MQIDSEEGLYGLVNAEGFDAVDQEISAWINMGEFDEHVVERAKVLEIRSEEQEQYSALVQRLHRILHPDDPWGWEFCVKCS